MSDNRCQFVGNEGGGFDREIETDGVITCSADAQVVVRLKKPRVSPNGMMEPRKTPVCQRHGGWLQESEDVEIAWEICKTIKEANDE